MRIVVIDGEACIRETFKRHFEESGHEVTTLDSPIGCDVFDGHECTKDTPCGDVLFIDYFLAGGNALDFVEKMTAKGCKAIVRNKFVMSGNIDMVDQERSNNLDCNIIQKPLNIDDLDNLLDKCLKNKMQKMIKKALSI